MSAETYTPEVLWAQRSSSEDAEKNFIYLTIVVPDADPSQAEISLKPSSVSFKGFSKTLKRTYQVTLDLYAEIDEAASKVNHTSRSVELKLVKKELGDAYWPRLLKDSKKVHFLKTDFDKWVDEDEQEEAPADDFSQFGGMGGMGGMGGGMGGMPGMGGDFGGIDFSKLGGAGGFGAEGDEGEDEEDGEEEGEDEMPALEGDEPAEPAKTA
ncbi:p23 chaperone protein wos2 [Sporothrix eucalyptigena]|uniref:P23 chaperone protein wos2 n=1 Tax=Sporothrix eucalyptigena TaxID=1812306 RepID=A0ABP0C3Q3_9PEZI